MRTQGCILVIQSCPILCAPWAVALQAPLSLGFSRQEYWGGCHALLQGIFPTQVSCTAGGFFIVSATGEAISESPGSHHINPIPTYCRCFHSQRFDIFWFGRLLVELLLLSHLVISDSLWQHGLQPAKSSIHRILQARTLKWVASSFSSWPKCVHPQLHMFKPNTQCLRMWLCLETEPLMLWLN